MFLIFAALSFVLFTAAGRSSFAKKNPGTSARTHQVGITYDVSIDNPIGDGSVYFFHLSPDLQASLE